MQKEKRERLESKGWKVGTAAEFLGLSEEEITQVTKTARSSGAVGPNAKVPHLVLNMTYDTRDWILDYGSGSEAPHTKGLREVGYGNAWAHDFVRDITANEMFVDDLEATKGKWDIIFASNVLNIQMSEEMLDGTLNAIWQLMNPFSIFVTNYPSSPRKIDLSTEEIHCKLRTGFDRVHKTHGDIFVCSRPIYTGKRAKMVKAKEKRSAARLAKLMVAKEE